MFFNIFLVKIISFIFSMHPFIPHHDKVYTILKTIIWYFFKPFVLFSMQPIFIFALLSLSKNAYKHVPLELNSLFIQYVRPYYGVKIILNMQFSFCNYRISSSKTPLPWIIPAILIILCSENVVFSNETRIRRLYVKNNTRGSYMRKYGILQS